MKKKIQKYLAGEREGFSLVELIIVIAIMAILIGVIALAVIPNIQRSRESKDLSTLDSIASSVNVAVAGLKKSDVPTGAVDVAAGVSASSPAVFFKAVKQNLGDQSLALGSGAAKGDSNDGKIYCKVTFTGDVPKISVWVGNNSGAYACKYTTGPTIFQVTN